MGEYNYENDSELENLFNEWNYLENENIKIHNLRKRAIALNNFISSTALNNNKKIEKNINYCSIYKNIYIYGFLSLFSLSQIYIYFYYD